MSGALEIRPVDTRRELDAFIKLPFRLYTGEPNWVPPLIFERRRFLDRRRNPFFEHARAEYFLAWRDGRAVGRISAQVDDNYQRYQGNRAGHFGFFECEEDPAVAAALVEAAAAWLAHRGCDQMIGPCDFTTNDECGLLVEGHERMPLVLQPWTHRAYPGLLQGAGLAKAMDLLMWELEIAGRDRVNPIVWKLADRLEARHGITVRPFRKRELHAEVRRFVGVYHAAWAGNWGFVPVTEAEQREYANTLRPVLDQNWAWIAEKDGETVGAAVTLPDFNQVLVHLNGRLLPFGWAKALYWRRRIDRVRVLALGVLPEWQHTGVAAKLYERHYDSATRTRQTWGECGWTLETNTDMNRGLEAMGGRVVRRYRLYERALA